VAEGIFECEAVQRRQQGWVRGLAAWVLALFLCFLVPTAAGVFAQAGASSENRWVSTLFVAAAQAGKRHYKDKKQDFGDDNDSNAFFQGSSAQGFSSAKDGSGQPQSNTAAPEVDSDRRPTDSTRKADDNAPAGARGSGRDAGDERRGAAAGPPKTVAELLRRIFKPHKSGPHAMPSWPAAKVTRATSDRRTVRPARQPATSAAGGKLAQKVGAKRHARRNGLIGNDIPALPGTYKPNELLVQNATKEVLAELQAGGWHAKPGVARGVARFVSGTHDPVAARAQLQAKFPSARFGLNLVYRLANGDTLPRPVDARAGTVPCDPQRCYGPALIRWHETLAACTAGVKIGIIDTGVDVAHRALAWKRLQVHHMPGYRSPTREPHWHGTAVVSLLAGHPASGTPGLVPDADFVVADAFIRNKAGNIESDTQHLLWALQVLEQSGAQVVNMSLTGPEDPFIHQRLVELSRKGMVFVAAAGNGGADAASAYPAAYEDEVIAVTAVDRNQRPFDQANQGDYIDVAAPGVRIWAALPNNKEGLQSGTSFAAPFVTAIVAAIYKKVVVPALGNPRKRHLEAAVLAHLSTAKSERDKDKVVGLGLVRAPSNCAPRSQRPVPTAQWQTQVHYASSRQ
jgi:Subtilase family